MNIKKQMKRLDELKSTFDEAYMEGTNEEYLRSLVDLREGYQKAFGAKYELMMHVLLNHVDASLLEAI